MKEAALAGGMRVVQPQRAGGGRWDTAAMWDEVLALRPDALVWAAYGGIVPQRVIAAVGGRALNIHPSLLPRWRGADPVAHAILAGDRTTGVTLMQGTTELDAGPILRQVLVDIPVDATTGELEMVLAREGARLLEAALIEHLAGRSEPRPQAGNVTWAPKLEPRRGELDFARPAAELARIVRAYAPDPGAYFTWRGQRIGVLRASVSGGTPAEHGVLKIERGQPLAAAGAGWLRLDEVKPAGKRAMRGADWARGLRDVAGARLPS